MMTPTDYKKLQSSVKKTAGFLKILSNEDRLLILCRLVGSECHVKQLEQELKIEQPTLSQQLSVLRQNNLVTTRREGKQIFYCLNSKETIAVMNILHEQFCQNE